MVVAVASRDVHANSEEAGDLFRLKQVFLASVGLNPSATHQDDAIDLGDDVGEVVSDQDDSNPRLGKRAHRFTKTMLRENIEAVARLVEHQRLRIVYQRPGNQYALRLSGRHFRNGALGQMRHSQAFEHGVGALSVRGLDGLMVEDPRAAEESGEDDFAAARLARAIEHQVVRYYAKHGAQLKDVPSIAPQNCHRGTFPDDRIAFARNGLDQSRLAAAVRAQNRDVFACFHTQAEIIERDVVASNDAHVFQVHQGRPHSIGCSPASIIISLDVFPLSESSGGFAGGTASISNASLEAMRSSE